MTSINYHDTRHPQSRGKLLHNREKCLHSANENWRHERRKKLAFSSALFTHSSWYRGNSRSACCISTPAGVHFADMKSMFQMPRAPHCTSIQFEFSNFIQFSRSRFSAGPMWRSQYARTLISSLAVISSISIATMNCIWSTKASGALIPTSSMKVRGSRL